MDLFDIVKIIENFCERNNIQMSLNVESVISPGNIFNTNVQLCEMDETKFILESSSHLTAETNERTADAIVEYAKSNHIVIITDSGAKNIFGIPNSKESNGFRYPNKCQNPLIGVDIELFKHDLEFPYHKDRPECFYEVKVDGKRSSHEAFYDESLRWKMIKNRIEYSGGFIDANQVLYALNVTRNCKQPSWFSKSFAKQLICKYCTSEMIIDPFAGWGARYDAAKELKRRYIGVDFNRELIAWHHEKGRNFIGFGDANEFRYNDECSVLICPPYSDPKTGRCFEDYNFDGFDDRAKALSQCDWLKIVIKNVPNAKEYVMVCKIVDSGWEKYIVETKTNKSHFGKNNEYVIRVLQSEKQNALSL